jgi:large subunit ribosomal protein L23
MAIFKRKKDEDKSKESAKGTDKKKGVSMKDLYSSGQDKQKSKEKTKKLSEAEKAPAAPKKESKKTASKTPRTAYRVILKPLMTEKVNELGVENKYVFQVAKDANKIEIAKAIKEVYNVDPEKVNIIKMKGKSVRFGRLFGKRSDWKKAVVKLPKGKTINVHEGV